MNEKIGNHLLGDDRLAFGDRGPRSASLELHDEMNAGQRFELALQLLELSPGLNLPDVYIPEDQTKPDIIFRLNPDGSANEKGKLPSKKDFFDDSVCRTVRDLVVLMNYVGAQGESEDYLDITMSAKLLEVLWNLVEETSLFLKSNPVAWTKILGKLKIPQIVDSENVESIMNEYLTNTTDKPFDEALMFRGIGLMMRQVISSNVIVSAQPDPRIEQKIMSRETEIIGAQTT